MSEVDLNDEILPLAARMAVVSLRCAQAHLKMHPDQDLIVKVKRSELKQLADAFIAFDALEHGCPRDSKLGKQLSSLIWGYMWRRLRGK